jgi:hypothetical protein
MAKKKFFTLKAGQWCFVPYGKEKAPHLAIVVLVGPAALENTLDRKVMGKVGPEQIIVHLIDPKTGDTIFFANEKLKKFRPQVFVSKSDVTLIMKSDQIPEAVRKARKMPAGQVFKREFLFEKEV